MWERIGEMLDAGHATMDIVRELSIPENKIRSLQLYVQKYGPRRRLIQFARFKDALLAQAEKFGADLVAALNVVAQRAVSNKTKAAVQVRAFEAMTALMAALQKMAAEDAKDVRETDLRVEISDKREALSKDAIEKIKAIYGLRDDDDHGVGR